MNTCKFCARSSSDTRLIDRGFGAECFDLDGCSAYRRSCYQAKQGHSAALKSGSAFAALNARRKSPLHDDSARGVLPQVTPEIPARQSMGEFLFGGIRLSPGREATAFDAFLAGRPLPITSVRLGAPNAPVDELTPRQQRALEELQSAERAHDRTRLLAAVEELRDAFREN